jgi:hypothetical protein
MSRHEDRDPAKDAEKPEVGQQDRLGEDDKEGLPLADEADDRPSPIDTVSDPDAGADPASEIEERGEPFEGNRA